MEIVITRNTKLGGTKVRVGEVIDTSDEDAKFLVRRGAALDLKTPQGKEFAKQTASATKADKK